MSVFAWIAIAVVVIAAVRYGLFLSRKKKNDTKSEK